MDGAGELEKAYREEATRIRAALAARLGDVGLAEELVQDAFIEAIEHWRAEGTPPNPGGWLATTARRKAIDRLRRERAGQEKLALLAVTETPRANPGDGIGEPPDVESWASQDEAGQMRRRAGARPCWGPTPPAWSVLMISRGRSLRPPAWWPNRTRHGPLSIGNGTRDSGT